MSRELEIITDIAHRAGEIHLKYFGGKLNVDYKMDQFDPVTIADKESDDYIRGAIAEAFPDDEILSEESDAQPSNYAGPVWMVDPLDGTKDFMRGRDSFAVMIGRRNNGILEFGLVYAPVRDELFYAHHGQGAFSVKKSRIEKLQVASPRSLAQARLVGRNMIEGDIRPLDPWLNSLSVGERISEGSIGLKLARIAEGSADLCVNTNQRACKWDTLAGQIILQEAGGVITDIDGNTLDYTKPTVNWDRFFVAAAGQPLLEETLDSFKSQDG